MVTENGQSDGNTSFLRAARAGHLDKVLEHLKSNIDINTSNANGLNALHLASKDGHVEVVEELLKRGAIVDAATKKGNTALHIASLAGQEEVVKILVQHGASVNVQSQNGFTPLYMAAQENHDNVVKYLLANGANQSLATEDGFTPLAVAMQQGHDKVVTVLLENDTRGKVRLPALHIAAKKDDVKAAKLLLENEHNPDVTSKSGFTPLHIASHYGNESIANLLIQKGADVNYAAKHNITPLHVAAKWGKTNMVALLLEKGANIESKTRDGLTPLHCAARSGHEQVVDMLLERGAPISSKTKNGLAPLHMAAQGDHVDAARILLYHRAPVDEVTVDYLTALHVAAHCGHVRVAKLLLDRQADANARALNGFTPLHIACKKNRIKIVELLLKHGASISATTESGLTPLHVASFMGCMNIVIYLLQHDANPDVPTIRGETPLHLAARANQTDIIRILLRNGAQVDARAREQQTPLHIASRLGNVDIVMLLLQHGAKVDATTKDMYTALHIAAKEGQDEVTAVLIENGASLNATTKKGFTPLHLAAKYGNIKVAKLLLQKEAPVDAQGKNGVTPLHVASHYDHQNVALLLLDKGASPHATAKNGHTPLHIAARKNQMDIANTLLEYGAQPNAESKAGFTPLHLSSQEGHTDMSSLLIEHSADTNHQAKNGLTPLHLCAQEDRVPVAEILVKNGAEVDAATKGGFTPLHIASHYGQINMVKFLLGNGANVKSTTSIGYTPLHQAAQQGHTNVVSVLLENSAQPNALTMNGQTPLNIAQKLGYISVIETLKVVTETTTTITTTEEKYRVVAPEAMQETFMSDSEEEGGEDTVLGDQTYRYLTADEMKSLGDDSLPIDVTRDERIDSNKMAVSTENMPPQNIEESISPEHIQQNYMEYMKKYLPDNVDIAKHPINIGKLHWKNFLVSFLVDARGGAMRGCRHSGVRVIVPPRCAPSPTRITCRYVRPQRTPHPPPLMEGEALASRILELGPVGAKFLGPVIIEVPHFAALRGKEREIVILRSDNGESWKEHVIDSAEDILNDVLHDSFEAEDLNQLEDLSSGRITRIVTQDFPQYFAVVSRVRQEVHAIGPEGGMVSSTVVSQVQAVFPPGALTKKIKVGLQAQPIDPELSAKLLGHGVAVSPVVTVEPRRRKFHKAITLSMPAPRAHSQGMINQYSGSAPTLRLLCSITGGTTRAQWEDVTGSTPLTFVNDCVSFTTTVSARFWLMDCRNIGDATKMATELYREAIHVPFMAKFVVFAKRIDPLEARLRVFCMTDDKEDKTLEHQEHFTEVAKSRDVEVLEGKPQYIEFAGNLVPITKSGEQLQFSFRAFRENRLPFSVRVKDQHAEAVGRSLFMREPKVPKGEPPQQPICILNIVLPDDIVAETISLTDSDSLKKHGFLTENFDYYRPDPRLADMSNLLGEDWIPLAHQLGLTTSEINVIKSEYPDSVAKQAQSMLRMWIAQSGNKAQSNTLENALQRIGREDIIPQCLNVNQDIPKIHREEVAKFKLKKDASLDQTLYDRDIMKDSESVESLVLAEKKEDKTKKRGSYDKYSAEEKVVEETSDEEEEDFSRSVPERRQRIEKRLSIERTIPASSQRVEIVQEISSIKRQSIVEDKIAEVEQKAIQKSASEAVDFGKTTKPPESQQIDAVSGESRTEKQDENLHKVQIQTGRRDSDLLEDVTKRLETTKKAVPKITAPGEPRSPKLSKTPPPSPADFIIREQATTVQEWDASIKKGGDVPSTTTVTTTQEEKLKDAAQEENSCGQLTELTPKPKPRTAKTPDETQETLEKETTESSIVDETLDYSERKKFWENFTKEKEGIITTKKRMSLHEEPSIDKASLVKKRTSVHEVSLTPPVPKPRHVLQTKDTKSIDESTESLPADVTDDSTKPISEYQASYQHPSRFSNAGLEKTDSLDSELEFSTQNQSCENTGYISDSGDVEHYISDSEIEDRVPQIRERQMSVCEPYPAARKTIYERSASLPTEDLYEVSARSAKLRKQYYEQQIKKEMIAENLMTESEDEPSPELKTLDNLQIKQEEPPGIRSVPEKATEDEKESSLATVRDLAKTFGGTISKKEPTKTPQTESEPLAQKDDSPKSVKDLAKSFEKFDKTPKKGQKSSESDQSVSETDQDNLVKEDSVSKPSDSMEVHVDKSEIEDSEKLADLDQDATDLETKSLDSLNATETSPKLIASVEDNIPEITVTLSGKQRRISEESDEEKDQEIVDKKVESPINIPEEHVQDTIWEVSVESHLEEQATEMVSLETSKIDMKSVQLQKPPKEDTISPDDGIEIEKTSPTHDSETYTNDKLTPDDQLRPKSTDVFCETERDEEFSGSVRDESDLGSEIHQDHSDSYASDKIKSESHSDIEKIILESLHQQHVDPEEAKKIASALIEDIEKEIQKRNELELDLAASPEKVQVSDYLRQLAETKGLDQREVELVESVLARRQRELAKLARGDTQASSMEITDEDLRYSGAEIDYNNVLEQQIDQLEAEKSKTFDKIEEEINAFKDKTTTIKETDEEKYEEILKDTQYCEDGERKTHKIDMHKKIKESTKEEKTAVDSIITESKCVDRKQETIVEEHDETLSDSLREDTKTSASTIEEITHKTDTKKEIVEKTDKDKIVKDETITEKSLDESKILGGYTKEFSATSKSDDGVKEVFEKETEEIKTTTSTKKDTQVENVLEIADDLEEQVEKTHTKISSTSTIVDHAQKESKTVSSKILGEIVEADLDKLIASGKLTVDQEKGDVMKTVVETHQEIKRTSSDESKSSQEESAKSPEEQFSTCSSGRKGDSDTVNKASEKHGVVLRKTKSARDDTSSSSSNLKIERKSGVDFDSSSGESHYQSFELDSGKSRPCSSDVEGLLAAGSSEYESALTSQDVSARSHLTSAEYHTAVSSLGSKESMRSLDSESSGNLASVEVSEASETLVPSTSDLDDFVEAKSDLKQLHGRQSTEMSDSEILEIDDSLNDEESKPTVDTQSKMKRSHEMTFQPEPKVLVPDSPQSESTHDIDERFGTSLDEGSVLSVSLSSTSSAAALRTVIELSRADSERLDGMTLSGTSDQITLEDLEKADVSTCTIPQPNDQISSVTMITSSSISENGVLNVSTQVSSQTHPVEKPQKEETTEEVFEPKKKGHRRYESTSFIPQMIPSRAEVERISELAESDKYTQLSNKEISSDEKKDIDESYETEADQGFHKDMREGRFLDQAESEHKVTTEKDETKVCQVRKLSGTSSEKSSFESEAEAEAAFSMVAHVSPAHKIKQICPILEDEDAEKHELETRERAQKEYEKRRAQMYDQSPGAVPDIKITQHMTPLVDRAFHYPDLELEEKEEALKETPETPASNSSKSSEETDQGREYVLDDTVETITESKSEAPTAIEKTVQETDSPNSDSFELIEKPDPLDDFVVIEEVAKEAQEHDTEGKSVKMPSQKYVRKHDEEVEELLVKSAPATVMTELKYYPEGSSSDELGFEFEDSPPQLNQKQQQKSSRDYVYEYDRELEANKKWIEQQFQGDQAAMAAAGYGYEMDFERGPLEDIKEEDVNDFDPTSSRIGSLGSQKESGGSLGSVKDSFSSTPEYDVLAGRKYFTRSGEHDDVSMSSLQEFENLERAMSLENRRCHQGSQDSSSNGSFGKRYYASKSGQGDDVSVNSLKEFEGLEKACIAAHKIEVKVKEEEAMLAQIEEGQESIASESESCETISGTDKKLIPDSDEEDYEKRMFEIDEIIRQAQTNVERFIDIKDGDKTESIGRGDSFEEVSKVPDLDLDAPIARVTTKVQWAPSDDVMITSTDSLDLKQEKPSHHDSTDSLDQKTTACDIMTASTDSIEFQAQKSKDIATDSIETKEDRYMVSSDSLELATGTNFAALSDSIDEDGSRIGHDHSTSSTGRDFSSSVKEEIPVDFKNQRAEYMLGSTDSLDPSSSTATHATYQYETDSVYSGSFTSGGSNTMVSSTDTIDPNASHSVDLSVAVRKVWFDDNSEFTTEYFDDSSKPYVTEVIEPCPDDEFSHTIHRRVELPPEIRKITFRGTDADQQLQQFIENFGEGEHTQETEEVDEAGNVHVRKIVQKRYVVKTDEKQPTQGISKKTYTDSHGTKTIYTQQFEFPAQDTASAVHSLLTSIAGDSTAEESKMEEPATSGSIRAQATRRRQLRYDISLDDQTEVDPREHDWRFYLPQHAEGEESSGQQESRMTQQRTVADQHQLSEEMKELLKHMEEESKK